MSLLAVRARTPPGPGAGFGAARRRSRHIGGTNMTRDPAQRSVRVLVVDDHADVRFLVRTILQDAGPAVTYAGEAASAGEAVAALEAHEPDVVVLDARMPAVDGFETAAMLLERRPGLPI